MIPELIQLVDKVLPQGQVQPSAPQPAPLEFPAAVAGTAGIGAGEVENPPLLCWCENEATKTFDGRHVCDECWDQLRYWQPQADEGRGY